MNQAATVDDFPPGFIFPSKATDIRELCFGGDGLIIDSCDASTALAGTNPFYGGMPRGELLELAQMALARAGRR
ncbi:MAG: hypothetical protein DCF30_10405 [Hyphomicrobiales bacterium]|nr:MAG: hypothetical protein DCF30_10405 [Hyphomicrobiales bacterium]